MARHFDFLRRVPRYGKKQTTKTTTHMVSFKLQTNSDTDALLDLEFD